MASSIPLEDHELEWWHEPEEESQDVTTPPRAAKAFALEDVDWADDKQHPDYRHLDTSFPDQEFELTAADLELIIRENRFEPAREEDRILFGLRGAMLVGGSSAKGPTLRVRLNRPNHREFRCIIGVYDTSTKQLSGFVGSTVPWYAYVYDYYTRGRGDPKTNLLPTGCYPYFVGPHGKHQIPGCFRLGTGHDKEQQERVAVLRTLYDVRYDTSDIFDPSIPHDNLHPSFGGKMFRSRGCQTVRGSYDTGHTGEWAEFRTAAGLGNRGDNGKRFDYLLVTGVEAAIASKLRTTGLVANSSVVLEHLTRLRHGSRGELVSSLQRKLGLTPNGNFGAQETRALAALQRKKFSFADGIYSPAIDTGLQYNILKSAPAAPQPVRHIAVDSRRIALVIGNGAYTGAQALGNPVGDAHAIAEKLKQLNFSVTLLPDASERALVQGIVKFKDDLTACHVGLIFYAGHGVQIDGENYVLPVDCNPATQAELRQSSVALSTLLEPLEESGKVGIIILDCCRDNPFRGRAVSRSLRRGFANLGAPAGTFIAFSTQPGATAADGEPGKHSPFATSLLQHITSEDVEIDKLMRQVRKEVNEKTEGRQLPWDQSSLMVDHFAFKQSSRGVEQRVLTREELDKQQKEDAREREDEYWSLTSRSNSEELLESFIAQYPDSRFRSEADDKLAAIRAEAARVKARARRRELQFRGLIVGTVLLGAVVLGLWLGNRYVSDLNRDLRNWQALAFKGQFKLFLAKARDKLDGDSPDEARAQMLAAYRIFKERGKELDRQLRVDFSNVVTESLKQDGDVSLEQSAGVQPKSTQAAFTPDGKQIVWAENGQGKLLNISDAQNGRLLAQQPRYANNVRTVITSPDGTHAALLSEIGDAELFFIGGGRFPDYYSVYRENDLRAITFSSGAPLLAAVDKNGDIFGWRFSAKGELLAGTEKLSGAAPLERDEPTGAGFAISCFEYLCVWATPDGRAHAARLGAKPGSDWKHLQGSSKLEGWSSSGPPYIRLGKNQLFVYAGENLVLYEVGAKQDTFKLKSVHTWRLPALVSLEIDAQERLAAIYAPDKTFSGWTVTYLELIQKNAKLELNPTYSRDFEREIIDFNWPTKSVIFAPLPRAGLDVLKRRADTGALHEHNCSPSCNVINWLGASDRTVVGVNRTKLDNVESGGFAYQLRLGDADSEPTLLPRASLRNELMDALSRRPRKEPGQPVVHPVAQAFDPISGSVFALVVAPEFASETRSEATRGERVRSAGFVAQVDLKSGRLTGEPIAIDALDRDTALPQAHILLSGLFTKEMDRAADAGERLEQIPLRVLVSRGAEGKFSAYYAPRGWVDIRLGKTALLRADGDLIRVERFGDDGTQTASSRRAIIFVNPGRGRAVDFGFLGDEDAYVAYEDGQVDVWALDLKAQPQLATITTRTKLTSPQSLAWSFNPTLNEHLLHVRSGRSIKTFDRAGLLVDRYGPGRAIGAMVPLANGDLFTVVGIQQVVMPAVVRKIEMSAVPYAAEALTSRALARFDNDVDTNWVLPEGAVLSTTSVAACSSDKDRAYERECTRLHNYYKAADQRTMAIAEHAFRALERKTPGKGVAFAFAEVAAGNPLGVYLVARDIVFTRGVSPNAGSGASLRAINCIPASNVDAAHKLFAETVRRNLLVSPFQVALQLQCGGGEAGSLTSELEKLGDRGDAMAFILLGQEAEKSAQGDVKRLESAIENYGIAGRLLLAQRDRRMPSSTEALWDQDLIDNIEHLVNSLRSKIAERMEPSQLAKVFEKVELRFAGIRNLPGKREPAAATPKTFTAADIIASLEKSDLVAAIAKGEGQLDEMTSKKASGRIKEMAVRGHYEMVYRAEQAGSGDSANARNAYVHFLNQVRHIPRAVYADAIMDLYSSLDEKTRQEVLPTATLRNLVAHFAQRASLNVPQQTMSSPKRAEVYLALSSGAHQFPKLAARLAIAALQTSESLPRIKDNVDALDSAQKRVLQLMGDQPEHEAEFKLIGWNYINWANDYLNNAMQLEPARAADLFETGLQLHQRYVDQRANRTEYKTLRQRLAADYKMAGRLAFKRVDYKREAEAYAKVIELNPADRDGYMNQAKAYENQGNLDNANGRFEQARAAYKRAVDEYARTIAFDKKWDEAYRYRGGVLRRLGEFEKSIADFNMALTIDKYDPNYFLGRGHTYLALGDFDKAFSDFNKVIELRPRLDEGYRFRGIAYTMKGEFNKAIADFDEAHKIDPNDANYFHGRAWAQFRNSDLDAALSSVAKAVALHRLDSLPETLDTHGQILQALGRNDEATAAFKRAQELKPGLQLTRDDTLKRLAPF